MAVDPVRGLARVADDAEHVLGRKIEDRQPVEDLAPGDAQALVAPPGETLGAGGAFVAADAKAVDEPAAEAGIEFEKPAQFPLDRRSLEIGGTPASFAARPHAALLDAVEQDLAGRNRRHDERHAGGKRRFDMGDDALPFDFAERGVNRHDLVAGDDLRQQDRHCLTVLATTVRHGDERAGPDHFPALAGERGFRRCGWTWIGLPGGGARGRSQAPECAPPRPATASCRHHAAGEPRVERWGDAPAGWRRNRRWRVPSRRVARRGRRLRGAAPEC